MKVIRCTALLGLGLVLSGCATVINGTSQDFSVRTDPEGARANTTTGLACTTPCSFNLKRRHDLRIDLTKEGYKPEYVLVQSRMGGAIAGNLLLGGLVGGVVDASNGASNHLEPGPLYVRMVPVDGSGEAMLLDKNGKEDGSLQAHNDKVRADVAVTIGEEAADLETAPGTNDATPAP